ncbi:hypothetical protein DIP87_12545 [Acinetobacter baumannii]|uniref:hypothetical protein n=1 Tax=Acinetobacter baumannii TaxID=470 RepID=UPI0012E200D8|nr:hypothetical protein [Acinetobacter baumannii]MUS07947.1 hypothetical protein [Acinetobacter baumannii]
MAEYIKILNDNKVTIIDDSYRNFHLINKFVREVASSDPLPPAVLSVSGYVKCHVLNVTSLQRPIVVFTGVSVMQVRYEEISTNNWKITVIFDTLDDQGGFKYKNTFPFTKATYYVFGLITLLESGHSPKLLIKNGEGEIVFSNSHNPLKVVKAETFYLKGSANYFSSWLSDIPDYNANKTYGLALACPAHYEYYWGAGGLSSYMHSYCTIKTNSYSDPTFSGKILRGYTILANGMNTSASLYSPFHSHLIVDITGY